jgi:hypothetical protein
VRENDCKEHKQREPAKAILPEGLARGSASRLSACTPAALENIGRITTHSLRNRPITANGGRFLPCGIKLRKDWRNHKHDLLVHVQKHDHMDYDKQLTMTEG